MVLIYLQTLSKAQNQLFEEKDAHAIMEEQFESQKLKLGEAKSKVSRLQAEMDSFASVKELARAKTEELELEIEKLRERERMSDANIQNLK